MSSKRKTDFGKTNEHVLQGYLQHMFKAVPGRTVEDTLRALDGMPIDFPFYIADAFVMYERVPVIPCILSSGKGDLFDSVMSDTAMESPILWVDSFLSGRDSLFVAVSVEPGDVENVTCRWLRCMGRKELLVGTLKSRTHVLACRMNCFSAC